VPLRDKRRVIGSLTLLFGGSGRRHTGHDLWLAEELARCAASALVQARLLSEAQAAVHARDDFLSIAGHELRTPLTALQLQVLSIARMLKQGEYGPRVTQRAEKAAHNVLRVSKLVDELLDISRLSAGRLALERSQFDLREAVHAAVEQQREEALRAQCELTIEADEVVLGSWDRARIEQVISTLLSNAIKYGRGKPIRITVTGDEHAARVSVHDAGVGIEQADQERIFQRFERGDALPRSGGLGLGLWIARELVQGHGGSIRVESAPGAGARFEVTLPRAPDGGRSEAAPNAHAS
jgi:signal transduction histidine kinase